VCDFSRSRGAKALENGTGGDAELTQEERDELTGSGRSIFTLIFVTVVREGVETAVFIGGVGASNWRSLPLPAFVGIILGLLVGFLIVRGGRRVSNSNLKWFFYASAVFLFFVAAGFTNYSADEIESIFADNSQKNGDLIVGEPLWDLRYCCHETQNGFFAIFRCIPVARVFRAMCMRLLYWAWEAIVFQKKPLDCVIYLLINTSLSLFLSVLTHLRPSVYAPAYSLSIGPVWRLFKLLTPTLLFRGNCPYPFYRWFRLRFFLSHQSHK
jgi:hypothetical protein